MLPFLLQILKHTRLHLPFWFMRRNSLRSDWAANHVTAELAVDEVAAEHLGAAEIAQLIVELESV